ncbi:hypothetical protein [Saccharopolyspora sp. NPDC002686]|uniref:hypothetical protein n=1 Tax=Saccharopolyspora sp. NPDC002686 TaxID=3154541 RepID=UPI0033292C30
MNARIDLAIIAGLAEAPIDSAGKAGTGQDRSTAFLRHLADLIAPWSALHLNTCRTGEPDGT